MNKKELVKALMNRMQNFGYFPSFTNVKIFIREYKKLAKQEPQKPVVPQFVADWYEKNKNSLEFNIFDYVYRFDKKEESDLKKWFNGINTNPFQTLVNMHQFGYEVEEEKRYLIKVVGMDRINGYLIYNKDIDKWSFGMSNESKTYRTKHTRKELEEAGFGEVFNSPLFEVEEVKE